MELPTHFALEPDGVGDQTPPETPVAGPQDGPATEASSSGAVTDPTEIILDVTDDADGYQQRLGARLRAVRRVRELRLQDVEERSGGRFKAVVVGSYERGDRAIAAHKLAALAAFYEVPVGELLPGDGWSGAPPLRAGSVRLSITALRERSDDPRIAAVLRLVEHIRRQRGDHDAHVVTVRSEDLRTTAVTLGVDIEDLPAWLERHGVVDHR